MLALFYLLELEGRRGGGWGVGGFLFGEEVEVFEVGVVVAGLGGRYERRERARGKRSG